MMRLLLTALLPLFLLQGCKSWGQPEPGDPAPLVEFEPTVKVKRVWSTSVGDGMGKAGISMPSNEVNRITSPFTRSSGSISAVIVLVSCFTSLVSKL